MRAARTLSKIEPSIMTQVPLFVENETTLRSLMRLSGVPSSSDADAMISNAIMEVRGGFIRRLGLPRITVLVAMAFSDTPVNENESLRLIANITETKWVKSILMRTLTTMFLDGAGGALQDFQNEAPFRSTGPFERDREIKRLQGEIEENLQLLEKSETLVSETEGHITLIESTETPPLPGGTAFA